jgi:hypothetical protein
MRSTVQSTRRMRLTVKRPSTKGLPSFLEGSTPAGLDGQGGVSGQGIHVVITTCDTTKFLYCKTNDHLVPYRGGAEKTTYTLFLRLGRATYIKHHNITAHHVRVHNSKSTSPALPAL